MSAFKELYKHAYDLFQDGNYSEAQNTLNRAEELYNEYDEELINKEDVYILRGTIAIAQNDIDYAKDSFETALKINPKSAEACMGLGQIFFSLDMKNEAKTMFEWAVINEPKNEIAVKNLANINTKMGYPENHNVSLQNEKSPEIEEDGNDIYNKAYNLYLENKLDSALQELSKLDDDINEDVVLLKGDIYLSTDKLDEAKKSFESVLANNPKSTAAYNGLGEYFMKLGMLQDAKVMFENAVKINDEDEFALLRLAKVNEELGLSPIHSLVDTFSDSEIGEEVDTKLNEAFLMFESKDHKNSLLLLDEALSLLENVEDVKKNELISRIRNFKGFNFLALTSLKKAQNEFENSLKLNPDSSQACAGLGEVFYLTEQYKDSKTMFEWGVKNNNLNTFAVAGLAKVNKALGLPADHSSLVFGLSPSENEALSEIVTSAYNLFYNKEYAKTIEHLSKAETYFETEPVKKETRFALSSIMNFKGFCYLGINNINEARNSFERALNLNPDSSQACAGLGEVFYLSEKDNEAKVMYEWAIKNEPSNKFAAAGLEKVSNSETSPENQIKRNAEDIETLINSAYEFFEIKEYHKALNKLREAEDLVEEKFEANDKSFTISSINNFMGFNYLALEDQETAKKHFEKSLENNPESSQACAGLGEVLFINGNDEESKKMFEWAVKNNPENKYAQSGLAKVNKLLGLPENDNSLL